MVELHKAKVLREWGRREAEPTAAKLLLSSSSFVLIRRCLHLVTIDQLWITKHAGDKMVVEGLTAQQVCTAIERGSRFEQTEGYLSVYTYFSIAWKKVGDKYKIKTVYINK